MAIDSETEGASSSRGWIYSAAVFPKVSETQTSSRRWFQDHDSPKAFEFLTRDMAFFTCENMAHMEFYFQGFLPKILTIDTMNIFVVRAFNV